MTTQSDGVTTFIPETRIGFWFLGTETWARHVVEVALNDLEPLFQNGSLLIQLSLTPDAAKVSPSVF